MDHAVILHLKLSDGDMGSEAEREAIFALEDRLAAAIEEPGLGEFDGNEFGGGECTLYFYGPDADRIYSALVPILQMNSLARGGHAIKRYGDVRDPNSREVMVRW
ncbi:MAG TPA: hypothetical protein VG757_16430 [Devosia sp.]|nr:hypothetical protein [Devosia sp.]